MLEKYYRFALRLCKLAGIAVIAHGNRWVSIIPPAFIARISFHKSFTEFRPWPVNRANISQFSPIFHSQIHISRAPDTKPNCLQMCLLIDVYFWTRTRNQPNGTSSSRKLKSRAENYFPPWNLWKNNLLVHFSPFAARVLVRHVLIAKNKMRNRDPDACADAVISCLLCLLSEIISTCTRIIVLLTKSCLICTNTLGSRRKSEGSERRGWKVVYDSPIRAFNDFPRLTHSFVAAVLSELFKFYPMRVFFYLFILSCTYNKIYFVWHLMLKLLQK